MRQFLKASALLASAALALAACGGTGGSAESGADDPLIVYTNSNGDGRAEWLTEQAAEAGFEIEVVGQGGGDTTNKILAEAGNPVADVVFGLNHVYFNQLVDADTIEPYTPEWSEEIDPGLGDASGDGNYWPLVQQAILLTYDADRIDAADAPSDWLDLWNDPAYAGKYQSEQGMGAATIQIVMSGILTRYADPEGEMGISEEGWAEVEKYFSEGNPAVPDVDAYQRIVDGEIDYAQQASSGIPGKEEAFGFEVGVVEPEVGVPFVIEQVGIVKGTDQLEDSQDFIDWFGSAEVQAEWSGEFDSMPVNQGAIDQADPSIVEFHEGLTRQDIDWEFVTENLGGWVEKIELEYVG
ncbi:extracellular solute-binding protein [Brachybacterium paraconglomeratum]|uniref:extracellular solute-binding protein n=1 Tax=Brachybacterium paraconglomeratum TaxID=173362 RepID=UPI003FD1023B